MIKGEHHSTTVTYGNVLLSSLIG